MFFRQVTPYRICVTPFRPTYPSLSNPVAPSPLLFPHSFSSHDHTTVVSAWDEILDDCWLILTIHINVSWIFHDIARTFVVTLIILFLTLTSLATPHIHLSYIPFYYIKLSFLCLSHWPSWNCVRLQFYRHFSSTSVSYTHLDVYKRQVLMFQGILKLKKQ